MKHIISLAFSSYGDNGDKKIVFKNNNIRVTQFNLNFDFDLTLKIIHQYDGIADAFSISGIPPVINFKGGGFVHPQVNLLKREVRESSLFDGSMIKNIYLPYALKKFYLKNPKIFNNKKISLYSGAFNYPILEELEGFGARLCLGDPYFFLKVPYTLSSRKGLNRFINLMSPVFSKRKLKRSHLKPFDKKEKGFSQIPDFYKSDVFVGNVTTFSLLELEHLKDKTVFVDFLTPEIEKKLKNNKVRDIIVSMPNVLDSELMNFALLEACLDVTFDGNFTEESVINWIEKSKLKTSIKKVSKSDDDTKSKFAFIIHPLSSKHLFKTKYLKYAKPYSKTLGPIAEEFSSLFPGFYYGKIKGIVSEKTGKEVEGLIYSCTETPKKLMEKNVNSVYRRLINLTEEAYENGARLIGLGAYTKIVGDAGVTIASQSPIPVTTGNSLSACSTLWAAKFALDKLNFVKRDGIRYQGRAMVIGATGSIGAVTAKILAHAWKELVLVAPRAHKILELKEEIKKIDSEVEIFVSTKPETYLNECDLIITTTSAQGKKILDIMEVRPGAVICDVSRPFDIKVEDAIKRPDVMVIASGEVKLPGPVDMKIDIGLEGDIVYACLAETALLAMEGRYESFTLSRKINYKKVLEIDRMAKKHGVKLSCIMGHNGFITDEEFELCREHAEKKLKTGDPYEKRP